MINQFSRKVSDILIYSKEEANRLKNNYIGPEHLLLGLIRDGNGKAIRMLSRLNINLVEIKKRIELHLDQSEIFFPDEDIPFTKEADKILKMCILEARLLKKEVADTEHILLAILKDKDNLAATVLQESNVDYTIVADQLKQQQGISFGMGFSEEEGEEEDDEEDSIDKVRSEKSGTDSRRHTQASTKKSANDTPVLDNFSTDMTKAAEEGKLDPVVGREREIDRLAQILSRRKKNNPILIGEPGVGKSAIVEGLALRIIQRKVSRILFGKRVVALDMTAMIAGTKYRGQFEERIRSVLNELQKNPNIILFIDEIHTIVGAGSAAGSMDAANMLKPALSRGEIQCIGATTPDEYRKNIEKDGALDRRFQKIQVEPATVEETLQILYNIKNKYEDHHNVTYTDAALEACVKLTDRYIADRRFPDKAIDALDEAGSRVHLTNVYVPKELEEQEMLVENAKSRKIEAVKLQDFERAAEFRDTEQELTARLEVMKQEWETSRKEYRQKVDEAEIATVVSMMSGVPVQRMAQAEGIKLAHMKEDLQAKVIAQNTAVEKLVKAILRNRIGLKDPHRPIGAFMFLGPTGVGKTHLAKELAKYMFDSADALIRIDMSEFMEKFTVSRLVGAPPGYVGYEEGGQLTEKVRRKPYSIILLDEIEKAHSDVYNLLLQVMDEGRLTDSYGRAVDFKNTVIIMTSNIGTRQSQDFGRGIGFVTGSRLENKEYSTSVIQKALNKSFAPEFLNRVDEVIMFDSLSPEAIRMITDIELSKLFNRMETLGYRITMDDNAKEFLATKGYDVRYGARPLKRIIQTYLEDGLSEFLVSGSVKEGETIRVKLNEEKGELEMIIEEIDSKQE
ncbi:ATP-dependent Clp protease ATP-binding subunit ClpC [termite gut metagenome]|uniref:ATP-dependent Clp protease ATP-binding subunit ClpC n=1 Tax=termite gut metagenome TaxID=433724 RepID=A0A5J4S9Q8_9ZZZZ